MKLTILLTSLLSLALCAPVSENPSATTLDTLLSKRNNECGNSTFENKTTDSSPNVRDCEGLITGVRGSATWG